MMRMLLFAAALALLATSAGAQLANENCLAFREWSTTGPPAPRQILFSRIFTRVSIGVVLNVAIYITCVDRFRS